MLISKYHRIIVVEGKDSIDFLQGQISTDVSKQKIEQIFLAPLFKTKKSNKTLDVLKFNNLTKFTKKPIIALGGINKNNIKKIE